MSPKAPLEPFRAPTGVVLALAWASLMSLYIYNDYFSMYLPGVITNMSSGRMGPLGPATPRVLIGVSILLATPGAYDPALRGAPGRGEPVAQHRLRACLHSR